MKYLNQIGKNSKIAFEKIKNIDHKKIVKVLQEYNKSILKNKNKIMSENYKDTKSAKRKKLIDRLVLDNKRIEGIRNSINEIIKFKDPIGVSHAQWKRPNGLLIKRVSTPIGVIGVIYESRPNVTADVASLCFKSRNCSILRGGSEATNSNKILANLFRDAFAKNNIDKNVVQFIDKKNRKIVDYLLGKMSNYIDVIVPRGGKGLVEKVQKFSKVHVIGHLEGLCHIYVDKDANLNMASKVIINSKLRRTSICGAVETLLINSKCLRSHGIPIIKKLIFSGCDVVVDKKINRLFKNKLKLAKDIDWKTEYLDKKISIKTVSDVHEAINHILKYGTMHTDSIITNNSHTAKKFLNNVNSSIAIHNASTICRWWRVWIWW